MLFEKVIVRKWKVSYDIYKIALIYLVQSQLNQLHIITSYFLMATLG